MSNKRAISTVLGVLGALLAGVDGALAQDGTVVPSPADCEDCAVRLEHVVRLGESEGLGYLPAMPRTVHRVPDSGFLVGAFTSGPLLHYSGDGTYLGTIGGAGEGPHEYKAPARVVAVAPDSLVVLDPSQARASVLTNDLEYVRSVRLPVALFDAVASAWPVATTSADVRSAEASGLPLHNVDFSGSNATINSSFGGDGTLLPGQSHLLNRHITMRQAGGMWVVHQASYVIEAWSASGVLASRMIRRPTWFAEPSPYSIGAPDRPPPPVVMAVHEDDEGLLWIYLRVAGAQWESAWAGVDIAGGEAFSPPHYGKLYDTMIEVVDPRTERVVARQRNDAVVVSWSCPGSVDGLVV